METADIDKEVVEEQMDASINPELPEKPSVQYVDEYLLDKADQKIYALSDMIENAKRTESIKGLAEAFLQISFAASDLQGRLNELTDSMNGKLYLGISAIL